MQFAIEHAVSELRRMYPQAPSQPFGKTLAGLLIGTLILAVLFYLLERLFPEQPDQPALRKGTRVDAIYWFFDYFVGQRLAAAASIVVVIAAVALQMPRLTLLAVQPLWLQAVEALLVAEFCGYWSHRMMHEIPVLWRLHKVHHSSERTGLAGCGARSSARKRVEQVDRAAAAVSARIFAEDHSVLWTANRHLSDLSPLQRALELRPIRLRSRQPGVSIAGTTRPIAKRSTRTTVACCQYSISSSAPRISPGANRSALRLGR